MRRVLEAIRAGGASLVGQSENLILGVAFFGGLALVAGAAAAVSRPLGLAVGGIFLAGCAAAYVRGKE